MHISPFQFLARHRDFARYFWAMLIVNIAGQMQAVTIAWQIYDVARRTMGVKESAFLVGMAGLAQFLPLFLLALIGGSLADRVNRRAIVMSCLAFEAAIAASLGLVARFDPGAFLPIFLLIAAFGAARAFLQPASTAMKPMLVPREDMPRAISMSSLAWQFAVILGPSIGGLVIAGSSAVVAYGVVAVLYLVGLAICLGIGINTTPVRQAGSAVRQIREGLVYVWTNKIILGAMSLDLFAVLLGSVVALLPAFAADVLHVGPQGFGILKSGPAIGAAIAAFLLVQRPMVRHAGRRMLWAVAIFGVATLVFAVSRSMVLSVLALAVLGAADMISVYVRQTLVQIVTPDHMRGRVAAVSGLFISASNELGEFESGVAARLLGPVGAAIFGGVGTLVVTGLWAKWFPELRDADRLDGADGTHKAAEARPDAVTSASA